MRLACFALLVAGPALAGPGTFSVLKVAEGEKVTYKALPSKEAAAEKRKVMKASEEARAAWNARAEAFKREREKRGKPFPELEPEAVQASVAKDALSEEEAQRVAGEMQAAADRECLVVRIQGLDRKTKLVALPRGRIRARQEALHADYVEAHDAFAKRTHDEFLRKTTDPPDTDPTKIPRPPLGPAPARPVLTRVGVFPDQAAAEKAMLEMKG